MIKQQRIIADDFAYSPEISQTICALLEMRVLTGTSCMSLTPSWPTDAKCLFTISEKNPRLEVGLHFVLTESWLALTTVHSEAPYSLNRLLIASHLGKLNVEAIEAEFESQLDLFIQHFKRMPDFVDGHQHVHLFPQIRGAILAVLQKRKFTGWVRQCGGPLGQILRRPFRLKSLFLAALSIPFRYVLKRHDLNTNDDFAGIYDFTDTNDYKLMLVSWYGGKTDNTLIMCHPGALSGKSTPDPIAAARVIEAEVFMQLGLALKDEVLD